MQPVLSFNFKDWRWLRFISDQWGLLEIMIGIIKVKSEYFSELLQKLNDSKSQLN